MHTQATKTPHVHAELIKQWADGAQIQVLNPANEKWNDIEKPIWNASMQYRVKPTPKPDTIIRRLIVLGATDPHMWKPNDITCSNVELTFDGETHKLKSVTLIE